MCNAVSTEDIYMCYDMLINKQVDAVYYDIPLLQVINALAFP